MTAAPRRSTAMTVVCWAVIGGVVAAVAVGHQLQERTTTARAAASTAADGPGLELLLGGRWAVAVGQRADAGPLRAQVRAAVTELAVRPVDRLAVATVVRELAGPAAAADQLRADAATIATADSPRLRADAAVLARLYATDVAGSVSAGERADLAHDLGYFGRLAGVQGTGADPAARAVVLAEANRTAVTFLAAVVGGGVVFFLGFVGLVLIAILFGVGTLRLAYVPPADGGGRPVWLEAFAVWMVAYVGFSFVLARLPRAVPTLAGELALAAVTGAIAFGWPAWRAGLGWGEVARTLGWHRGRGVAVEVAWGLAGYVAGLPVVAAGFGLTTLLLKLSGGHPSHPLQQQMGERMSGPHVLGLLVTAAVLAPVLEETLFRGALYAHLRRRHAAWVSAAVVAVIFAAIHPQGWATIPVLGSIALVLAGLREWRGSLIAPVTAHALNNGTLVLLVAVALG